jgi:hypothetical protein
LMASNLHHHHHHQTSPMTTFQPLFTCFIQVVVS